MTDDKELLPADQLCRQLLEENAMLRKLLSEHHIAIPSTEPPPPADPASQPAPLETEDPTELQRSAKVFHYCLPEVTQAKNTMGNEKAGDLPDIIHAEGEVTEDWE